jgi:hypothetical protein
MKDELCARLGLLFPERNVKLYLKALRLPNLFLSLDRILVSHHPELGRNVDSLNDYHRLGGSRTCQAYLFAIGSLRWDKDGDFGRIVQDQKRWSDTQSSNACDLLSVNCL